MQCDALAGTLAHGSTCFRDCTEGRMECRYKRLRETKPLQLQLTELEYNSKLGNPDDHLVRSNLHVSKASAHTIMATQKAAAQQVATVHMSWYTMGVLHPATKS